MNNNKYKKYILHIINPILLIFLILSPILLSAQESPIKFDHLSVNDGLSQSVVNSIFHDEKGFMWFGTQDGLNKYDGYTFKVYKNIPFDSTTLSDNWVQVITRDSAGNFWIGTFSGGLYKFDKEKEVFTNFRHESDNPNSLINNRIWTLTIAGKNILWIGTAGGFDKFNIAEKKFTHYKHDPENPNSLSNNAVNAIYKDDEGILWLGTWGGGLNKFDPKTKHFTTFKFAGTGTMSYRTDHIKIIIEDDKNNLWLGTGDGVVSFNRKNNEVKHFAFTEIKKSSTDRISAISLYIDSKNYLWVGTHDNGVLKLDMQTGVFVQMKKDPSDPYSISDNWISSISEYPEGVLWFGTGKGINQIIPYKQNFNHIQNTGDNKNSLSANEINSVYEDNNGIIWIGTWEGGLNRFDLKTKEFKSYTNVPDNFYSIPSNTVWTIYEDSNNRLWVGTYNGLCLFNKKTKTFNRHPFKNSEKIYNNISAIYEDTKGYFWIGTWGGGLYKFYNNKNNYKHYSYNSKSSSGLSDNLITCIYEDKNNNLWIGTNAGGLNLYNYRDDSFTAFKYNSNNPESISNNNITSLYQDKMDRLWIGTWGGGLNYFNREKNNFIKFTESDGLANNVVYSILEDDKNNLWLSTSKGLSRFNITTHLIINYNANDGLGNDQFGEGSTKCKNGLMIFGGNKGLTIFNPEKISINLIKPVTVITSFKIYNKEIQLKKNISSVKNINLDYDQNDITIQFAALDFTSRKKNQYAYKLIGLDNKWRYVGKRRQAFYTNLDPGNYEFRVKSANNDNVWSNKITSLKITIVPPFWKTVPFLILVAILIIVAAYYAYHYRLEQLLKYERMRNMIALDLHDDIGASLTRISVSSDALVRYLKKVNSKDSGDKKFLMEKIEIISHEIGNTSRDIVSSMSDIVWMINPHNDNMENITSRMKDFTSKTLEMHNIEYDLYFDPALNYSSFPMDFRRNCFLIYKEAISNVMKHAKAKSVDIKIIKDGTNLLINVKDDGVGFDENVIKNGNGIKNIRTRAGNHDGTAKINSQPGKGTSLEVRLKIP